MNAKKAKALRKLAFFMAATAGGVGQKIVPAGGNRRGTGMLINDGRSMRGIHRELKRKMPDKTPMLAITESTKDAQTTLMLKQQDQLREQIARVSGDKDAA